MLADSDTQFSTVPMRLMEYVAFLSRVRTISLAPANWQEMFIQGGAL
jgi:hypothetical protein